jgi:hypothetical protein
MWTSFLPALTGQALECPRDRVNSNMRLRWTAAGMLEAAVPQDHRLRRPRQARLAVERDLTATRAAIHTTVHEEAATLATA